MQKYRLLILIAGLSILLLTQYKMVMPLVYKVIASDLFLVDSKDKADQLPISNHLTGYAFTHCNAEIKKSLGENVMTNFPAKAINSWTMGNYQYIINGEFSSTRSSGETQNHKYACRISYKNGENEEGAENSDNWSIEGISGIDH